jgi:hypothetical protein
VYKRFCIVHDDSKMAIAIVAITDFVVFFIGLFVFVSPMSLTEG